MPEPSAVYDAFVSYSRDDRPFVRGVVEWLTKAGVRCYYDEQEPSLADGPYQSIGDGLQRSGAIAVFVGEGGLGKFQGNSEVQPALNLADYQGRRLIVVLLPGATLDGKRNAVETFLTSRMRLVWSEQPSDEAALAKLYFLLRDREYSPGAAPVAPVAAAGSQAEAAVESLALQLQTWGAVTFFAGPRCSPTGPNAPPRSWEIAADLLRGLGEDPKDTRDLWLRLESVGPYYAVHAGPEGLEAAIAAAIRRRSTETPRVYQRLAGLVALLRERVARPAFANANAADDWTDTGAGTPRQLIVSTALDLMLERALIAAAVPFLRVIQLPTGARVETNFSDVTPLEGGRVRIAVGGRTRDVDPADLRALDAAIGAAPRVESAAGEALKALDAKVTVILYKYQGSLDVRSSFTVSVDHFIDAARRIEPPKEITHIISNTASVFLGCGILTAEFAYLYYTLLDEAFAAGKSVDRLALQLPPALDPDDVDRRLDAGLWEKMKLRAYAMYRVMVLEAPADDFLARVADAVREGGVAEW